MPVLVEPDRDTIATLLPSLPTGSQAVESADRMDAWLGQHSDEYVVLLGPHVSLVEGTAICEHLRISRPTTSVVLLVEELTTDVLTTAMQAGAREVVLSYDTASIAAAITRAYQLYAALRGPAGAVHIGKIITVWSPKGGVGKTTMAVNLGLALTERGARKVCLVDLDLAFGDVSITMQLFPTHSIEQAIGSEGTLDIEQLDGLLTRHQDSMMVLAAPSHPDVRDRISPLLVSNVLRTLKDTYDYVVVDTAPAFDEQTLTALDETDEVVIVATLDVPTLKNVKVALETLEMLNIARDHRHLLLNRADDEVGISPDKVEGILGMPVAARVATSIEVAAATNSGSPIVVRNPEAASSIVIRQLATVLAGEQIAPPPGATPVGTPHPEAEPPRGNRLIRRRR